MSKLFARRRSDDGGQALVLVLLITGMVMVMAATSVSLTASNIRPANTSADTQAATAAAQGGVDEFGLALGACGVDYLIDDCPAIYDTSERALVGADGLTRAKYVWDLIMTPDSDTTDVVRVEVTGTVNGVSRSVVADYRPTPSFLDYLYFTEEETSSPEVVLRYYGPRTVQLPTLAFRQQADKISSSRMFVNWSGAQNAEGCAERWYDSEFGPGRATLRAQRGGLDYTETTNAPVVTRNGSCDVVFTGGMTFSGKVYSKDAFSFTDGSSDGPMFLQPIRTEWNTSKNPKPIAPKFYRGDTPAAGSESPRVAAGKMSMPLGITGVEALATCVFTGPTRIKLEATVAVVTSPQTTLGMLRAGCTPTGGSTPALVGAGLVQARFPITQTTSFYVKSTTPVAAASATNPLFDLRDVTIGASSPAGAGQPALFYTEMSLAAPPVTDATTKAAAVGGPIATSLLTTLNAYLTTVNARRPALPLQPQYQAIATTATAPAANDPLLEPASQAVTVQRRTCTLNAAKVCTGTPTAWANAFKVSRSTYSFPIALDVTPYQTGLGNAFIEGTLNGKLTVASASAIVLTNDTEYVQVGGKDVGTLGLVADTNVEVYHPVRCATVTPVTLPGGTCPDDLTGLYDSLSGTFDTYHPSRRYLNMRTDLADIKIDAAMLARQGSFTTQNYLRGLPMGTSTITGGVYQAHRGPNGVNWGSSERSGYLMSMSYDARLGKNPPPNFVEPSEALTDSAWLLLGVSGETGG